MISRFMPAVITALLIVAAAEGAAHLVVSQFAPHSYEAPVNIYGRWFWQQYTAPAPRDENSRLVILISDSQGNNGIYVYPELLEAVLAEQDSDHDYTVANWSIPGGTAREMIILAARAATHQPDVVLLVTSNLAFLVRRNLRLLDGSKTDVDRLAYLPDVRKHLSAQFLDEHQGYNALAWYASRSPLAQLNKVIVFNFAKWGRMSSLKYRAIVLKKRAKIIKIKPWNSYGDVLLQEFYRTFHAGLPGTPLLIVNMPLNPNQIAPGTELNAKAFFRHAEDQLAGYPGITVLDALYVIDPVNFLDVKHLRREGHEQFSRWILPHVTSMLEVSPR